MVNEERKFITYKMNKLISGLYKMARVANDIQKVVLLRRLSGDWNLNKRVFSLKREKS